MSAVKRQHDKIVVKFYQKMNNISLNRKLSVLYVICVLFPLVITDSVVLRIVWKDQQTKQQHAMENEANAIQYSFTNNVDYVAAAAKQIYMNGYIEKYLNREYENAPANIEAYQNFVKTTLFKGGTGMYNMMITMYADNPTIINGGEFSRLSTIENTVWYQNFEETGQDEMLYFYYDNKQRLLYQQVYSGKRMYAFQI